ncbi:endolytic transglycosylase MltG [Gilvimarinus sp. F26214L]|uniref:endolytic transglycosylase MltG n=1 Tax=Gilvimarinus sp. DZF01 TaxID=3461371 RepID=UPI0040462D09
MRVLRKLLILAGLALVVAAAGVFYGYQWLHSPLTMEGETFEYTLPKGGSLSLLARDLGRAGVLEHPRLLSAYGRLTGRDHVRAGEYRLTPQDTPATLLDKVERGEVISYLATLVEGWTFRDALNYLQAQPKIEVLLDDDAALEQFLTSLELPGDHPEGWFFPDTYRYVAGNSDREILLQAHRRMRDVLATEWEGRAGALPYSDSYDALIMASIVERETGVPHEREEIAGVFVRRLEQNMRLQTDPTVIYGLADSYDGNIRRRHLSEHTPYNTYMIRGLPPTPIALPGREAIHAALHPAEGEALYFVARGDGSHKFSTTLEEHNKAVQEFQVRRRAKDYQSAPPAPGSTEAEEASR